ncbi:MAG: outer membrane lipoprotein carrier protein LolA [Bacteroidetes bacterium]|nr:outer membrane lipoprotein carrier protein LolA [Bacteroidota bacterium]
MRNLFLVLFFLNGILFAQKTFRPLKDTLAFKEKIAQMAIKTNTLESDFTQIKTLSMLSEKMSSKGHFCFKKTNLLRWEYSTPYRYIIVINKDKMLIKDDVKLKKYDINSNKIFKEINNIMISCIDGNVLNTGKFKASYAENEWNYKIDLIPIAKEMRESLKQINMYFDKAVSSVTRIEMIESSEDFTTIDFTNKKINGDLSLEKFTLK